MVIILLLSEMDTSKSFCAWRTLNKNSYIKSKKKGRDLINSFRLPTEEWEYSARED
jgi:hypothetical protein